MKLVTVEASQAQVNAGVVGPGFYVSPRRLVGFVPPPSPSPDGVNAFASFAELENYDTVAIDTVANVTSGTLAEGDITGTRWILKTNTTGATTDDVSYIVSVAQPTLVWVAYP